MESSQTSYSDTEGPHHLVSLADLLGTDALRRSDASNRTERGQFFTPPTVAGFMASMFGHVEGDARVLDAGAGAGSLTAALVAELLGRPHRPVSISISAYETDPALRSVLEEVVRACDLECRHRGVEFSGETYGEDFIGAGVAALRGSLLGPQVEGYDLAILNPPYAKLGRSSEARRALRSVNIDVPNLYAAFVALAVDLLAPGGELVAITPRSFCNGPYFRPFRKALVAKVTIRGLHIYEARNRVFGADDILQENLIFHAVKGLPAPEKVTISSSNGADDDTLTYLEKPYQQLVEPGDSDAFIRITTGEQESRTSERINALPCSLAELCLTVSTGRVVDFRASELLKAEAGEGTVPLLYPKNLKDGLIAWPGKKDKKPSALLRTEDSERLLVPQGFYVIVKRFSAKEEKRRVVAAVCDPALLPEGPYAFENHLNYYHEKGGGIASPELVYGLAAFLNSTTVDAYFRQFSGHTQVNAADLRKLRYPTREQLQALGAAMGDGTAQTASIDDYLVREVFGVDGETVGPDPVKVKNKVEEAIGVIRDLGLPRAQQNERSALTLLTLLGLRPQTPWSEATDPLLGVTEIMDLIAERYGRRYAPNSRETFRRQTIHQFLQAELLLENPDNPDRPVNSPNYRYRIEQGVLALLRSYGTAEYEVGLKTHLATVETLEKRYANEREMAKIPVSLPSGETVALTPGGQNVLMAQIVHEFCSRFTPGGQVLYLGDAGGKWLHFEKEALEELGVRVEEHGKMPDVVVHYVDKGWLVLIEAVTSHGPVDAKRMSELKELFKGSRASLVLVTAFLDRRAMVRYLSEIAWETEVWVADAPSHMIHFNGERFLGPY